MSNLVTESQDVDAKSALSPVEKWECGSCDAWWSGDVRFCPVCAGLDVTRMGGPSLAEVEAIRRDERERISRLLDESADTISRFAPDAKRAVLMVAYMLTLDSNETS